MRKPAKKAARKSAKKKSTAKAKTAKRGRPRKKSIKAKTKAKQPKKKPKESGTDMAISWAEGMLKDFVTKAHDTISKRALFEKVGQWSVVAFPDAGPIEHLKKLQTEAQEAIEQPSDITEYADCVMALFAAVYKAGYTFDQLFTATEEKFVINQDRKWERKEDGTYQHTETNDINSALIKASDKIQTNIQPDQNKEQPAIAQSQVDQLFESLYPDPFRRQANREWFNKLPVTEQYAWFHKMTTGKGSKQFLLQSDSDRDEQERVNNMSPEELSEWMERRQEEGMDRIRTDKKARQNEAAINHSDNLNSLPDEWKNDF